MVRGVLLVYVCRGAKRFFIASTGTVACLAVGAASWYVGAPLTFIVPPATTAASLFLLGSYPDIVRALHRDTTSLSDIEQQLKEDKKALLATSSGMLSKRCDNDIARRQRMYNIFTVILVLSTAMSAGLLVDYVLFYENGLSNLTSIESLGVVGGMLSLAKRVQRRLGSVLISTHNVVERVTGTFQTVFNYAKGVAGASGSGGSGDDTGDDAAAVGSVVKDVDDVLDTVIEMV